MPTPSQSFQAAIHALLTGDATLTGLVGGRIYDGKPPESAGYPRITYGPSDFVPAQLRCIDAREESVQIDVWTRVNGELYQCKEIIDVVENLLHEIDLSLTTHASASCLVTLARVFRDPDQVTAHGVVQVEAMIERR